MRKPLNRILFKSPWPKSLRFLNCLPNFVPAIPLNTTLPFSIVYLAPLATALAPLVASFAPPLTADLAPLATAFAPFLIALPRTGINSKASSIAPAAKAFAKLLPPPWISPAQDLVA